MVAFKKMLKELKLIEIGGYIHKDQGVGNCAWASAKAALGVLLRQLALSEKDGKNIYKQFTAYCRRRALLDYLAKLNPPDYKLLKLISNKIKKKSEFKDLKLLVNREAREKFKLVEFNSNFHAIL